MKSSISKGDKITSVFCPVCFHKKHRGGLAKFPADRAKDLADWLKKHGHHDTQAAPAWK